MIAKSKKDVQQTLILFGLAFSIFGSDPLLAGGAGSFIQGAGFQASIITVKAAIDRREAERA